MLETPRIVQTAPQTTAVIRLLVPREDIRMVMGPGLRELGAVLAAQGIAPTGPWFTHHFRKPSETFDFEICLPVSEPVRPSGRVEQSSVPGATVARTVHHGPYEGLAAAWGEFDAWVLAQGYTPANDLWECYTVGPESSRDAGTWRTELNRPLIGAIAR
jgi:effector-binding domain-containing protein